MRILFSHCNYPAQFRRLAPALAAQGHDVHFLYKNKEWHATPPNGVVMHCYPEIRNRDNASIHPYLRKLDEAVAEGQNSYRAARELKQTGWEPEVIISHAGFGNGLYLNDVFPKTIRIGLFEWFYNASGSDVDFIEHGNIDDDKKLRLRTWNAQLLLELVQCDVAVTPTAWQRKQFPIFLRDRLTLIHEGVDTKLLSELRNQKSVRPSWLPEDKYKIVSYVSRGFEEYRGFPQAMHALAEVQAKRSDVHVVIAGSDTICYGTGRKDGRSWQEWAIDDSGLDPNRTKWLGAIDTDKYQQLLAHTHAHLYLTVPFVLSWSLLEAMATGCPIVASSTAPVNEVIKHGHDGLLADFWQPSESADFLLKLLKDSELAKQLSYNAKITARSYDAARGLEKWVEVIEQTLLASQRT